ncbi:CLUMA_CG012778, isoform A [Clunio marinus]|uniref:CLUMA_CG012778, isoform A n=1 Tax=Clunio marinus TaxID=568069 RepID=A0A1J1IGQ3_9DIPT|nr:CLUMA_CG012778, isoform A [Clunio marinus]
MRKKKEQIEFDNSTRNVISSKNEFSNERIIHFVGAPMENVFSMQKNHLRIRRCEKVEISLTNLNESSLRRLSVETLEFFIYLLINNNEISFTDILNKFTRTTNDI